MTAPVSNLTSLVNIIADNVSVIEDLANRMGTSYPTISDLYEPHSKQEELTLNPEVLSAAMLAVSAASQLAATLKLPGLTLLDRANAFHIPSALRVTSEACVVEILRDAGPQGMHVQDIANQTGIQPGILGRSLRLLSTHYVFAEISPNVFVNNRLSSMMDTGKDTKYLIDIAKTRKSTSKSDDIVSNVAGDKYTDTNGVAALIDQCVDEVFKSSSRISHVAAVNDYSKTPFQCAMQYNGSMWEFFEKYPGYLQRIQMAMVGFSHLQPHQQMISGFDWSKLKKDSYVVDVGGGNGSEALAITKKAPHVKIFVEDLEQTIAQVTTPTWNSNPTQKSLIESEKVVLQAHDFFTVQPSHIVSKVSLYHLRFITHDWPTPEGIKILKQLRASSLDDTRLMLVDQIVPYACPIPEDLGKIEGAISLPTPAPLLSNLGEANSDVYTTDFTMAALLNAQERTLGEFHSMLNEAGWEIETIYQAVGSSLSQIVCKVI
ncbi:S-adenosyl-L-methionine-dependent methyltransferase [Gymnopus androsaceus JB14]|uniref:S-adenosyl-L-methionine-dependent methyltransferase n=1 Tax=Gymnopus androsaceus JB14 TaxID=1447944 RepID=A0A6A4GL67_9AGAR|nr:S-adenosyl-L-methionine-dependent methyltransferase [Gymnopus androsaceus JB14]KAE9386499.1 S-adenosyl-L-methionine-dependent methyltransferase [Gymnopus androsaceus JB14]